MKKTRVFDRKKCPYKQLLAHKGSAIIMVSRRKKIERMRVCGQNLLPDFDQDEAHCIYTSLREEDSPEGVSDYYTSCYAIKYRQGGELIPLGSYKETIRAMRDFDKRAILKIVHIDFYDEV